MTVKKIKAGALQLVTYIAVIIALLLGCFVLLLHTQNQYTSKTFLLVDNLQNVYQGIDYAKTHILTEDTLEIAIDNDKSIKLNSKPWGLFQRVSVVSKTKSISLKKTALLGYKSNTDETALYLKDNNRALVLVGDTNIEGNCYLPARGIKSGNISGVSFTKNQFVKGKSNTITKFPKLQYHIRNSISTIVDSFYSNRDLNTITIKAGNTYLNSFENQTQYCSKSNTIFLEDVTIKGNVIIQSSSKIIVDTSATLVDVILIAPEIEIGNNVHGALQAFATKSIKVGRNCMLQYPSTLVLNTSINNKESNKNISIASNSEVQGSILFLGKGDEKNYNPQIEIQDNATIKGEVYCEATIELKGKVYGTVYANSFVTRANGSYYQNHLLNAEINKSALNEEYVGIPITNVKKDVAKWLY